MGVSSDSPTASRADGGSNRLSDPRTLPRSRPVLPLDPWPTSAQSEGRTDEPELTPPVWPAGTIWQRQSPRRPQAPRGTDGKFCGNRKSSGDGRDMSWSGGPAGVARLSVVGDVLLLTEWQGFTASGLAGDVYCPTTRIPRRGIHRSCRPGVHRP